MEAFFGIFPRWAGFGGKERGEKKLNLNKNLQNLYFFEPAGILGRSIKSLDLMEGAAGTQKKTQKNEGKGKIPQSGREEGKVWVEKASNLGIWGKIHQNPHFWVKKPSKSTFLGKKTPQNPHFWEKKNPQNPHFLGGFS